MAEDRGGHSEPGAADSALSRRTLLGGAALAGAAAWVAPAILSIDAAAASTTTPTVPPSFGSIQTQSAGATSSLTLTELNLNDPGSLVAAVSWRGTTGAPSVAGWDLAGVNIAPGGGGGMAVYTKLVAAVSDSITFAFAPDADNVAAAMLYYVGAKTGREPLLSQTYNTGSTTTMSADAITTGGPNRMAVYAAGWATATGSPVPSGFTTRGVITNGAVSLTLADQVVPVGTLVGPTDATIDTPDLWVAGQVAVF